MTGWELAFLSLGCLLVGFLAGMVYTLVKLTAEPKE